MGGECLRPNPILAILLLLLFLLSSEDSICPRGGLEPLVWTWPATTLVMRTRAPPTVSTELLEPGSALTLPILATGERFATLTTFGMATTERGAVISISAEGTPPFPIRIFQGSSFVLDRDSVIGFNQDGEAEARLANAMLEPADLWGAGSKFGIAGLSCPPGHSRPFSPVSRETSIRPPRGVSRETHTTPSQGRGASRGTLLWNRWTLSCYETPLPAHPSPP